MPFYQVLNLLPFILKIWNNDGGVCPALQSLLHPVEPCVAKMESNLTEDTKQPSRMLGTYSLDSHIKDHIIASFYIFIL